MDEKLDVAVAQSRIPRPANYFLREQYYLLKKVLLFLSLLTSVKPTCIFSCILTSPVKNEKW